ncbi:HNH endonuclease [Saliphagus sp. LR7]|uniref:HNH endonuclease n=1 Tax=Saliphagus sp. LR7 TaxID=2282654 RepID=UPI000DF774D6|nr:HNH endonuclease [Saliphagus sp. LR7]
MSRSSDRIKARYDNPDNYSGRFPPDWEARRKRVYRRDDWTCQNCGRKSGPHAGNEGEELHAHHIQEYANGGSNSLSNLETLCGPCHQNSHDHDIFRDDGPRVYGIGALRASPRGVVAAVVFAVWVGLLARLFAWGAGTGQGTLEDEAVWIGLPAGVAVLCVLLFPFYSTVLLGLVAAGSTVLIFQGFGLSPQLLAMVLVVWPPVLIGAWAFLRGHLRSWWS